MVGSKNRCDTPLRLPEASRIGYLQKKYDFNLSAKLSTFVDYIIILETKQAILHVWTG